MIAYFDSHGVGRNPWYQERSRELAEAIMTIYTDEFGDRVHQSGPADFLVRQLAGVESIEVRESVPNCFLIVERPEGLEVAARVGGGEIAIWAAYSSDDEWFDGIQGQFRRFREQIEQ